MSGDRLLEGWEEVEDEVHRLLLAEMAKLKKPLRNDDAGHAMVAAMATRILYGLYMQGRVALPLPVIRVEPKFPMVIHFSVSVDLAARALGGTDGDEQLGQGVGGDL